MSQEDLDQEGEDILRSAQSRLIQSMSEISHDDEAGRAVKDLVTSTTCLLPIVAGEFRPEVTTIMSPDAVEELLTKFGQRLLESQAEWAARWNKRRG
jgi:hypothetical protein